jgi:hypothetical protein
VPSDDIHVPREKKASRISHVLSNFGGHIRASMVRSPSQEHSLSRANSSVPTTPSVAPSTALVESPHDSPNLRTGALPADADVFSNTTPRAHPSAPPLSPLSSSTRHPLLDHTTVPSSPARPTITFELASPNSQRDRERADPANFRPRANSDVPAHGPKPPFRQTNSTGNEPVQGAASSLNMHRKVSLSPTRQGPRGAGSELMLHHAKTEQPALTHATTSEREEQRGAFMKFIRDLPNMLPGRTSVSAAVPPVSDEQISAQLPRRHQKGEVVCLHYGTIDDLGMRQLEGRS